ncbi:MAG: hypothetical protein BZ136_07485 [Methanosphaera sp. rholeuAM74]|nr:MAG: hypothetical protein BZ136_07485 [Methanosphaera sp. rholeuAM74]
MNQEEYEEEIKEIKKIEEEQEDINDEIPRFIQEQEDRYISKEESIELIKLADETLTPLEELQEETQATEYNPSSILQDAPELRDILNSQKAIRCGTKARIPIPLNMDGTIIKVYVRGISGEELAQIQQEAENTGADPNHLAACIACYDSQNKLYSSEELESLGYANERKIGEAITITSGESSDYTTEKIQERAVQNLING